MHDEIEASARILRTVALSVAVLVGLQQTPAAHEQSPTSAHAPLIACPTAGTLGDGKRHPLHSPFDGQAQLEALFSTDLWKQVAAHLWVNRDRTEPCFGSSDTEVWTKAVSGIPADIVGLQATKDRKQLLVYASGIPDYMMETPRRFVSFKPGNIYGIFRIAAEPTPDDNAIHDLAGRGAIGFFVNGVSIFNYTDTFSYNDQGAWSYDANVAEALIVNSDVSHATPSDLPQFPKSRGIFHNHQMSIDLLKQLHDPFVLGAPDHSKLVGFAIDSTPIYGPLGFKTPDQASGIGVLKSSYVKRGWLAAGQAGTGHRSSLPGWAVNNGDGSNEGGANLVNLFQKPKAEMLYRDGASAGPIVYSGEDARLAAEIKLLSEKTTLHRDGQGFVYWESQVTSPDGAKVSTRNYLLGSSTLWGPDLDAEILPVSYQVADKDLFYFKSVVGTFAEDYEFIDGYGDLDFHNGIDSYLPERKSHAYHYVTSFDAALSDSDRLSRAAFPYFVGIQYRNKVDPFNDNVDDTFKRQYLAEHGSGLETIFDLGIVSRTSANELERDSVIRLWQKELAGN